MGRIAGFLAVPVGDKVRLLVATTLLLVVRVGVFVVSFSICRRLLLTPAAALSRLVPGSPTPARVAQAVDIADTHLPGERTCLMRSLTTETLHRLYDHDIDHRIGVDKTDDGTFEAHSWIEHDGEVLIGDLEDISRFEPLPSLNGADWS
ncbi:lasso peptide biosynthesis B2 protein [Halomontanus rarus]|uniref:lasso peptide biosynthesis B2 protein n=1 Tax=Halomontanus rarus TaxID=3034020 RepID=UPI0023E761BE|nr:lasso peptide biosynthesis B2 protein [Halovivax sp. TS33]